MTRTVRVLLAVLITVTAMSVVGCSDKNESEPNKDLGAPGEVKPGRGKDGKGGMIDAGASKQPVKK